ncbi:MAG: efflux RND transporter periplasmic adaptor subunit [Acidobacteriia bacterium]|nr:efflux RND transporter periplasmic adaptor subunit [Terriglobia bacterium]
MKKSILRLSARGLFNLLLLFLSSLFLATSLGCSREAGEKEPVVSVQTAAVKSQPISEVITTQAALFPLAQAALSPKITAPVKKFLVNRGDHVRKGQLLAVLENRDLSAASVENKGVLDQAEANLTTVQKAAVPEEVHKAELDVKATKEAMEAQQKVYDSRKFLFEQGALPRRELDSALVTLVQLRAQYEVAQKHLDGLLKVVRDQELKTAQAQVTSARGKFLGAEALLSYSEIHSPIDGVVTDRPAYPGETATTGTPFMTVMDISRVIAKAHISASLAADLKKGTDAEIRAPGLDDALPAKVTVVSPATDPNSTTVEVWIEAANPKGQLKPGTTAEVSMTVKALSDALVVPASALLVKPADAGGGEFVMVVGSDGRAHERTVRSGIRNGDQVQIVSGLKAGEQIISTGNYGLPDNTKIQMEKAAAKE